MPRKPRVSIVGVPEHIIQRGNNRQVIFASDDDMKAYVTWLEDYAVQFDVAIHAWVLMTNHVHILCTPGRQYSISNIMQALGRKYVQYFNRRYKRSGTLWEGPFRSCLVQDESYLLRLYRYIELNPVRAGIVDDPADYSWSNYQCNGLAKVSKLLSPHLLYQSLGKSNVVRYSAYRELFRYQVDGKLLEDIRNAANKGLVLGSEKFVEEAEALTGKQLKEGKRGRPVGWRKATKSS